MCSMLYIKENNFNIQFQLQLTTPLNLNYKHQSLVKYIYIYIYICKTIKLFGLHIVGLFSAQHIHQYGQLFFSVFLQIAICKLAAMLLQLHLQCSIIGNHIAELLLDVRYLTITVVVRQLRLQIQFKKNHFHSCSYTTIFTLISVLRFRASAITPSVVLLVFLSCSMDAVSESILTVAASRII